MKDCKRSKNTQEAKENQNELGYFSTEISNKSKSHFQVKNFDI